MSLCLSKEQLIEITGGSCRTSTPERVVFRGVEFDSREIRGGELFIALKGEKTHGHSFLTTALQRGAALFLVEEDFSAEQFTEPHRLVYVKDTLLAFATLASWWRKNLGIPVLAITGSVGKTTVKELAASILLQDSVGGYSLNSYNNHTGVPYTISKLSPEQRWGVLEMGMNHAGEISVLSKIGAPNVAAITTIGPAHIENLGSLEGIAREKLDIVAGLKEGSPLIVDGESEVLIKEIRSSGIDSRYRVLYFGRKSEAKVPLDGEILEVQTKGLEGITITFSLLGQKVSALLGIAGAHNAKNAVCAALSAKMLLPTLSIEQIKSGLEKFRAPLQRLATYDLTNERVLVDDSYNANPLSMKALLEIARSEISAGKRIGLVLGDMFELGDHGEGYHREIGKVVGELKPQFLVAVGERAKWYSAEAKAVGVPTHETLSPEEGGRIATTLDFDILLVKGSRGVKLERAVQVILNAIENRNMPLQDMSPKK